MEEKDLYPYVEQFLYKNKDCIEEYVGNELSFGRFRTDVFGVSINDEEKMIYLLEGKLCIDGRNVFSKVISETSFLNRYADYIYIFGKVKNNFEEDNSPGIEECKDKGIGILIIDDNNKVREFLKPKKRSLNDLNKKETLFRIFNKKFRSDTKNTFIADFILQATYEYSLNTYKKCAKFIDIYNALFSNDGYKELLRKILGGKHSLNERGMRGAFQNEYGDSYYIGIIKDTNVKTDHKLCINEKTLEKIKPPILLDTCKISSSAENDELIADTFARRFSHWKITLPENDIKTRHGGFIQDAGWLIQYCFGKDGTGEYLDYYAAHRMTDDSHVRIYEDGREESLSALSSMYLLSDDPLEAKRLKDEYEEHNREVVKILNEKGFNKFTINMFLQAGRIKK